MSRNIALIGCGYWGKNIARNLHELGTLRGVLDPDEKACHHVAERYPEACLYSSFEEVLADEEVAGIAICTPAETHASLAISAMRAGKHVFVEKPLALTFEEGQRMVRTANERGCVLMVGHLLEYHPAVRELENLVRLGDLGKLQYIYSNRLNLGKFRNTENILWSFAPHDIAVILRLVGEEPIEVFAAGGAYLQPNISDTTVTNLLFDNGVRAHVFVSWLHPYKEQRLVVIGSKRMAVFDDRAAPSEKLILYDKGADWVNNMPIPRQGDGIPVYCSPSEPLALELSHFAECMKTSTHPRTDGESGLRVLRVLQAAQQSLQTGGTRVPFFQRPFVVSAA